MRKTLQGSLILLAFLTMTAAAIAQQVTATWTNSVSPTVTGYRVYRRTPNGTYALIGTTATAPFKDANVSPGATYLYVATAVDGSSVESVYSNEATAVIPGPPPPPGTITFGNTTTGTTTDTGDSNAPMMSRFVSGATGGVATSISAYVAAPLSATPNNKFQVALYSDNVGNPGTLIAKSSATSGTLIGNAWNTLPITANIVPNTPYWLAYNTNGTSVSTNNIRYNSGGRACWRVNTALGTWPSPFVSSGCSGVTITIYLTLSTATPPISVIVSPKSVSLLVNQTQQFTAAVSNTIKTGVDWTASCGMVDTTGLFTAPATQSTCVVRATSQADTTKFDTATVTVNPPPQPSLTLSCSGLTCTFTPMNIPSGTVINVSGTSGSVSANATTTVP